MVRPAPVLVAADVLERLRGLDNWESLGGCIRKVVKLATFKEAIALINQVAELSEAANHHPDIIINYNQVTVELTTYESGGVTHRDFDLAKEIDMVLEDSD